MYRYLDHQGRAQPLADEEEVRAAIADGRVRRVTPFAADSEPWTMAGRHPAYQRNCVRQPKHSPSLIGALAGNARYRKFARVAAPLFALALGVYARRGDFADDGHDDLVAAMAGLARGEPVPAALLASPPRRPADKIIWVVMTAAYDAEQEMMAAEQRYGVTDMPDEWLTPRYLRHAREYPHIARYFDAMQQFHRIYRDSLMPITERALQRRAAEATLKDDHLAALFAENRTASRQVILYYDVLTQWAREGRRLHGILAAAEPGSILARGSQVVSAPSWTKSQYDSSMRSLAELEARRDTLEAHIHRSSRSDLAKLTSH